jgi:hypothetical protein
MAGISHTYATVWEGESVRVSYSPHNGIIWGFVCGAQCADGIHTVVVTKQTKYGKVLDTFVESSDSSEKLVAWLRRVFPAELLNEPNGRA